MSIDALQVLLQERQGHEKHCLYDLYKSSENEDAVLLEGRGGGVIDKPCGGLMLLNSSASETSFEAELDLLP